MRFGTRRTAVLAVLGASAASFGGLTAVGLAAGKATTDRLSTVDSCCKFNKTTLTAKPGKVTLVLKNTAGIAHNVAIKGKGITTKKAKVVSSGSTSLTVTLKKGTYTYFCSVDGHEAAGMKGTLKVK